MDAAFEYVFPAIRGVQAQREYYVSMCPLRLIPKLFVFDDEELVPELRAQRTINRSRVPEIARYILKNPQNYTFSAITASVDADLRFDPIGGGTEGKRVGLLHIPMSARFIINDGQHRRAAIEIALKENPDFANESIAVVFFLDIGLERCQQMFADLNRHAIRPSKSIGVLYDHRDDFAKLVKLVVLKSPVFKGVVDMERSTLSPGSRKLFTLSAIYTATLELLADVSGELAGDCAQRASTFWEEVGKQFPEWQLVRERRMTAGEVRQNYLHSHGIALQALGRVGNYLMSDAASDWKKQLSRLKSINWLRSNSKFWEGRALAGGRVSKSANNVTLTTNIIKKHLRMPLSQEEDRIEQAFLQGSHEQG
ncbi:MAG TPA: DNA sulfur modification protein DndB [Pyrinomonadaceae bacterium]|nr:DNA sulfur modification protein DndB [Pyrinomonadaceae bacterium]